MTLLTRSPITENNPQSIPRPFNEVIKSLEKSKLLSSTMIIKNPPQKKSKANAIHFKVIFQLVKNNDWKKKISPFLFLKKIQIFDKKAKINIGGAV